MTGVCALGLGSSIVASALPIFTGEARKNNLGRYIDDAQDEDIAADNIKWGVMGIVSVIPWFNWLVRMIRLVQADGRYPLSSYLPSL